jgi:hypothetical protein
MMGAAAKFRRLPWMLRMFAMLPDPDPRKLTAARWSGTSRRPGPTAARFAIHGFAASSLGFLA